VAYLVTILIQGGLKYVLNVGRGRLVEDVTRRLREVVYGRIDGIVTESARSVDGDRIDTGAMVSMVAAEVEDVGGFVGESISLPLLQGGTLLAVAGYLFWLQPLIAAFAIFVYLPQILIVPRVQRIINRHARLHARQVRRIGAEVVHRATSGARDTSRAARFAYHVAQAFETRIRIYRRKFFLTFVGNFLDALGPLLVLLVGGWLVIRGEVEAGTIVVFISGFHKISGPWDELVNFYRTASNAQTKYNLLRDSIEIS